MDELDNIVPTTEVTAYEKEHLVSFLSFSVLSLFIASGHASVTTQWTSESRDYAAAESIGSWQVIEYKDAVAYNANNVWTIDGESGGYIDSGGSTVLWFAYPGSFAAVEFYQPSTSIAFMLQSDANDGLVNFYVDNTEVLHHFDMQTLPGVVTGETGVKAGTLIVPGLQNGEHSVKIETSPFRRI